MYVQLEEGHPNS